MSDLAVTTTEASVSSESGERGDRSWLVRWAPLGGLVWFLAYPVGFLLGTGGGDTPAEIVDRADSHEVGIGIIQIVVVLSPFLLGWFFVGLYARLRAAGADAESVLALVGGTAFTVLLFLADTIVFAPLAELPNKSESVRLEHAQTILALEDVSWLIQAGAGVAAALMIIGSSLGARRGGSVTGWMFGASLALGVVSLATIGFVGVFAWLIWIGLASIGMLARR